MSWKDFVLARQLQLLVDQAEARLEFYGQIKVSVDSAKLTMIDKETGQQAEVRTPDKFHNYVRRDRAVIEIHQRRLTTVRAQLGRWAQLIRPKKREAKETFHVGMNGQWVLQLPKRGDKLWPLEAGAETELFNSIMTDPSSDPEERVRSFSWFVLDIQALQQKGLITRETQLTFHSNQEARQAYGQANTWSLILGLGAGFLAWLTIRLVYTLNLVAPSWWAVGIFLVIPALVTGATLVAVRTYRYRKLRRQFPDEE